VILLLFVHLILHLIDLFFVFFVLLITLLFRDLDFFVLLLDFLLLLLDGVIKFFDLAISLDDGGFLHSNGLNVSFDLSNVGGDLNFEGLDFHHLVLELVLNLDLLRLNDGGLLKLLSDLDVLLLNHGLVALDLVVELLIALSLVLSLILRLGHEVSVVFVVLVNSLVEFSNFFFLLILSSLEFSFPVILSSSLDLFLVVLQVLASQGQVLNFVFQIFDLLVEFLDHLALITTSIFLWSLELHDLSLVAHDFLLGNVVSGVLLLVHSLVAISLISLSLQLSLKSVDVNGLLLDSFLQFDGGDLLVAKLLVGALDLLGHLFVVRLVDRHLSLDSLNT